MLSPQILERLSQLNRELPLSLARASISTGATINKSTSASLPGEEYETAWGTCWCIERSLFDVAPVLRREIQSSSQHDSYVNVSGDSHPELRSLSGAFPHCTLFLDLETCGFAGSMIFLAGLVRANNEGPTLMQLVARNYAEEKALLQALWQVASDHQVLVTFNGKTFDWPSVHDRSTIHHLGRDERFSKAPTNTQQLPSGPVTTALNRTDRRPHLQHVDLLHHCRRKWKDQLPNCRLQTLERFLCGRRRVADISGAAIPDAYHQYVRGQNPLVMRSILHHNALDLVTLVQLALRVCRAEASEDNSGAA